MDADTKRIKWREGEVDRAKEHFELRYGSADDSDWSEWIDVALVGIVEAGVAKVQFLPDREDQRNAEAIEYARKEIQFYLVDLKEEDPWRYAQYHCGTSSNIYSKIHWTFHDAADSVLPHSDASGSI